FKNPIVSAQVAKALLAQFPHAPHYPQANGSVKLAAGWLIDQCELKGQRIGGAAVHRQQALVLINEDRATSEDVVKLAHYVRQRVGAKF
ncbi:UDP-N-acetylenolpyruvoylglucosamine reductase, partial [Xanthomonas citri pv. citri]|nr:UDP-N-acetylenolpyruvoylglucosamine reductase [Xanthomonas citri pv. citri]